MIRTEDESMAMTLRMRKRCVTPGQTVAEGMVSMQKEHEVLRNGLVAYCAGSRASSSIDRSIV